MQGFSLNSNVNSFTELGDNILKVGWIIGFFFHLDHNHITTDAPTSLEMHLLSLNAFFVEIYPSLYVTSVLASETLK
jgi:hypothetical protein